MSTEFWNHVFLLIEAVFLLIMPLVGVWIGYKIGWRDAKEQSFKMTRAHHHCKIRY